MSTTNDKLVLNTIFNPLLPTNTAENDDNREDFGSDDRPEDQLAIQLEIEAVNAANGSDYDKSLQLLNDAISKSPKRASRAQVYRVKGNTEMAFEDLNRAISLSKSKGLVARQAYCQRGLIYLLNNKQTEGIEDMKKSAQMGNEFAKSLVVQLNPYAALCNKMLKDMIDKVRSGEMDQ